MKNIDYLYKRVLELDELYTKITIITGFTAEQLLDLFERGFVLIGQDDIKENEALRKNEEVMRQMTNADMIRAMSDEELAEVFCDADWCNACGQLKQDGTCHAMEMGGPLNPYCKAGCLTWLRQSAVEEVK